MTAKNISTAASPTMASPILPSTASSVVSADSPIFSHQSVHNKGVHSQQQVTFDEIKKCEQQQKKEHYSNNKRRFCKYHLFKTFFILLQTDTQCTYSLYER